MSEQLSINEARLDAGGSAGQTTSERLFAEAYGAPGSSNRADAADRLKDTNDTPDSRGDGNTGYLKPHDSKDNSQIQPESDGGTGDAPQAPPPEEEEEMQPEYEPENEPDRDCEDTREGEGEEEEYEEHEEQEEEEWNLAGKKRSKDNGMPRNANSGTIDIPKLQGYA